MTKNYAIYITGLILFGSNGITSSLISLSSHEIAFYRSLLGSLVLLAVFLLGRNKLTALQNRRELAFVMFSGVSLGVCWLFLNAGYKMLGVSLTVILTYCGPIIVMALSPLLFHAKLTRLRIGAFGVVLLGLVLVNSVALAGGASILGIACGLGSALGLAGVQICTKQAPSISGLQNSLIQMVCAFATVAVYLLVVQGPTIALPGDELPLVLLLGIVQTGVAGYFYFAGMSSSLPVQSVAVLGYLEPLTGVLLSAALLGEQLLFVQVLGAVCVIGGAVASEALGNRTLRVPAKSPARVPVANAAASVNRIVR